MSPDIEKSTRARLARIEGQVRGLIRMIDEDRYCIDVVTQVQAVRAALARVETLVLKDHIAHCVADAAASGDQDERDAKIGELIAVMDRVKG